MFVLLSNEILVILGASKKVLLTFTSL